MIVTERTGSYRYDAFISYSHHDKEWVRGWLLPRLGAACLRVCIDFRDFELGAPTLLEMERAVLQSRKTLLVLTPDYLASEWAKLGHFLTSTLDPAAQQRRVIPLLLKPCELPLHIGGLTCLDFTQPSEREYQCLRLVVAIGLAEENRRLWQLKELHHRLQITTLDIDVFQSFVRLAQQASPPAKIEDLEVFWQRQCSPGLAHLGELLKEEVDDDIHRVIDDIVQWKRNLEKALKDKHSTLTGIYDLLRAFWDKCMHHLLWADSELHEVASNSCELSDSLMVLMMEAKRDNKA
jgi:hypothetical protein